MELYGLGNLEVYIIVRGTLECCEHRNTETKLTNRDRINTTLQVFKSQNTTATPYLANDLNV